MKIGWHAWEPGLYNDTPTSAGGALWTSELFRYLKNVGHEIMWLPENYERRPKNTSQFYDIYALRDQLDIAVFCWRWGMPDKKERQDAYIRQNYLLGRAIDEKLPVIIYDQDHKMTIGEIQYLAKLPNIRITSPSFFPIVGETLMFPNPFHGKPEFHTIREEDIRNPIFVYIGNNYERYEQAKIFFNYFGNIGKANVWGNWLEESPHRESPEQVLHDFPNVNFKGRLSQTDILSTLKTATYTAHLCKPTYLKTGFITIRWAEATAAGIPALIPGGFRLPNGWHAEFDQMKLILASSKELHEFYLRSNVHTWYEAAALQSRFVYQYMRMDIWEEALCRIERELK